MARNTSILLGDHYDTFVSKEISSGKYKTASEVIRTALRLLENHEEKKKQLSKALIQGEKSGYVTRFNSDAHLKKLRSKIK